VCCILGYTIGNDISCRFFQLPEQSGGQFFYAKAFDKFAPIGPVLVSPESFNKTKKGARLTTRVNGETKQNAVIEDDMIFDPARVLSWMSQSMSAFHEYSFFRV
jgi:2-keto-4-pentenoate hydratase/2-oxohepta-3-ene-1,7-dioic acid hydratase in catechol pathway